MLPRISIVDAEKAKFLLMSTDDFITQQLFTRGVWEDHLLGISKIFYDAVEEPLVIDVGANLGAYSIPIAKDIQDRNGVVYGFEAQRIVYYQLCGNVFLNRLQNYYAFNSIVTDSEDMFKIPEVNYATNKNIGAFSVDNQFNEKLGTLDSLTDTSSNVKGVVLDNLQINKSPALIKIDVEGHELSVLNGGKQFLEKHKYPPILFEAWADSWFAEGKSDLMKFFKHMGYVVSNFDTSDFVAQHPSNSVGFEFSIKDAVIWMNRVK